MAEAALKLADWISLADIGEHMRQKNDGHRGLARADVQAALEAGCGLRLRWVGDDGREVCREFPKRDSWEDILVWAGLPQRLCVQLPPDERKGNLPYPYAYLLRADAVRHGLWPASESPQAKQQSEPRQSPPATQPDEPVARAKEPEPPRVEPAPSPALAADAVPKPIGPAATEPAAQSSLEVLASAFPPLQEPTPTTPKTLPDTPEMILSVLGLKGFQQEAIAKAVPELYGRAPPESLTPGKLRKDLTALHKVQAAKAKARGDAPPAEPAGWDACKGFVTALRAWRANGP
jgi:hypothetical protein